MTKQNVIALLEQAGFSIAKLSTDDEWSHRQVNKATRNADVYLNASTCYQESDGVIQLVKRLSIDALGSDDDSDREMDDFVTRLQGLGLTVVSRVFNVEDVRLGKTSRRITVNPNLAGARARQGTVYVLQEA